MKLLDRWVAFVRRHPLLHRAWSRLVVLPLACLYALWRFSAVRVRLQEQRSEAHQIAHWLRNKAVYIYGWIGISWRFRDAVPGAIADHLRERLHQQRAELTTVLTWLPWSFSYWWRYRREFQQPGVVLWCAIKGAAPFLTGDYKQTALFKQVLMSFARSSSDGKQHIYEWVEAHTDDPHLGDIVSKPWYIRTRFQEQRAELQALYEWLHYGLTYPVPLWSRRNPGATWNALILTAPWHGTEASRQAARGLIAHVATGSYDQVVALRDHFDAQDCQSRLKPWWDSLPLPGAVRGKLAFTWLLRFVIKDNGLTLPFGGVAALWLYAQPFHLINYLAIQVYDFLSRFEGSLPYPHGALTDYLLTGDLNIMQPDQSTPAESRQLARLVNITLGGAVVGLVALCAVGAIVAPVGLDTIQQAARWAKACAGGWLK